MGQRAKLSRQHSERWAFASHAEFVDIAEREARAILAQNDPDANPKSLAYLRLTRNPGYVAARADMIASLAAFCEE